MSFKNRKDGLELVYKGKSPEDFYDRNRQNEFSLRQFLKSEEGRRQIPIIREQFKCIMGLWVLEVKESYASIYHEQAVCIYADLLKAMIESGMEIEEKA